MYAFLSLFFLDGRTGHAICGLLSNEEKVYWLGLCMPYSTVSNLSPRWLTNLSNEQFRFILSSSVCWASKRSIFKLLSVFLSLSIPLY